ncbi:MAG: rRNA methyltransferase [Bacilli bacterium]|nr:rRNA methyltransferase [Bacilli bacterium]
MTDHYYSAKPTATHELNELQATLRGKDFTFITDAGVFSKKAIDFGSQLLIQSMDIARDHRVLDVGCGYGPIGLSAASLADLGTVTMLDINERAIQLSQDNANRNGLANVNIIQSDLLDKVKGQYFDRILTNPPIRAGKDIVHRIFAEAYSALVSRGQLWIVIQKKQGAPSAFTKLQEIFGDVQEVTKDKGYRIFKATKID